MSSMYTSIFYKEILVILTIISQSDPFSIDKGLSPIEAYNHYFNNAGGEEMQIKYSGTILECIKGDIVSQKDIMAIVNAANAQLLPGGGVAGAIHRSSGPELAMACRSLAPIRPGDAVITPGFNLPNRYVIHTLGPRYGVDKPEALILTASYQNSLRIAEVHDVDSLAFPAISTGVFGYPVKEAAQIAIQSIFKKISQLNKIKMIRFVLFNLDDLQIYEDTLNVMYGTIHGK